MLKLAAKFRALVVIILLTSLIAISQFTLGAANGGCVIPQFGSSKTMECSTCATPSCCSVQKSNSENAPLSIPAPSQRSDADLTIQPAALPTLYPFSFPQAHRPLAPSIASHIGAPLALNCNRLI